MSTDAEMIVVGLAVASLGAGYAMLGVKWPKWLSGSLFARIYGAKYLRFIIVITGFGGMLGGSSAAIYGIIGVIAH